MENDKENVEWMDEKVTKIKGHNFFYKVVCFFLGRWWKKLTYKDLFLLYYGVNRKSMGEHNSRKKALQSILKIYKQNNGDYPQMVSENNNEENV